MSLPKPQCSHLVETGALWRQGYSPVTKKSLPKGLIIVNFFLCVSYSLYQHKTFSSPPGATYTVGKLTHIFALGEVFSEVKFFETSEQPTEVVEGISAWQMWSGITQCTIYFLSPFTCSCNTWEGPHKPSLHIKGLSSPGLHWLAVEWWPDVETASWFQSPLKWSNVPTCI